jgi:hypothetical protein
VKPSSINTRDLKEGDRAPDILMRKESAVSDWKKRGLKQPEADSQWSRVGTGSCCSRPPTAPFLKSPRSRSNPVFAWLLR